MKTRENDFEARVAELERLYRNEVRADSEKIRPRYKSNRPVKGSSVLAGFLAGSLMLFVGFNQELPKTFSYTRIIPDWAQGPDPHTIEGTAAIHKQMQSGTVNVSKSTITGIVDSQSMTASLYWTFVLKNNNNTDKEAAITIDLPKNSALSRATLWINGVAQEAAFSSNTQVQSAYDSIVVRHRDPLLVTQIGPNKIKILAAPVTANGGEMQFRIGITTPAEQSPDGGTFVKLPSIVESNLQFDSKQDVHLSSMTSISGVGSTERSGIYTLRANLPVSDMKDVKVVLNGDTAGTFATRLTHTNPTEYVVANVVGDGLELKRVNKMPSCKFISDNDVAFRLSNLWAHQEIERLAARGEVNAACNIANVYRIVSSVSGATVLEVDNDYSNNGLNRDAYRTIGRSSSSGDDFTTAQGFQPYHQNGADAFSSAPMPAGQINGTIGAQGGAPMLQGATNGTIGPQGADATVIQGVNTSGTVRVNNLANLEVLLTLASWLIEAALVAAAAFLVSESVINDGIHAPIRLSRMNVFLIGLAVGVMGFLTPAAITTLVACLRDANLFS